MKTPNKEREAITNFIKNIGAKDFASANEALKQVLHEKLKNRIRKVSTKPLF